MNASRLSASGGTSLRPGPRATACWRNRNVKAQLSAVQIHNWTAMHVWLYIWREQAPYNALYGRRLDRIGCFMCPSSDMALIHMIAEEYTDLWQGWTGKLITWQLITWQQARGLPREWVTEGRWRIREGTGEGDDADSHY